jgi:hypothetical protein
MEEETNNLNEKGSLKTVRTYLSDMADTVRTNDISVIKVALAEQNKNERENIYKQAEGTPFKKFFWVAGGIILIGVALFGIYFVTNKNAALNIPEQIVKNDSIISYDELASISVKDGDNLTDKIIANKKEVSTLIKSSGIKSISINKEVGGAKVNLSVRELFTKLGFTAPSSLVRSLSDSYMVGSYINNLSGNTADYKSSLFLILPTTDYEYTYAGMLEWEKTIAGNTYDLFELDTKDNKLQVDNRVWKDIIIENKDARVLLNEENKPILYYMFTNKNNLIITDKEDTLKEITSRLVIKNIKPL